MDFIATPWPWYVSGPLITLTMGALLFLGKNFGMSSNLRTICTLCGADKTCEFFSFDWKSQRWNLLVLLGTIAGGFIAANYIWDGTVPVIHKDAVVQLKALGINSADSAYLPLELFDTNVFASAKGIALLFAGGLFVGFGSRYAGGCTSGHAISGLSNLQLPSLLAVVGFFIGGLLMIHLIFPLLF